MKHLSLDDHKLIYHLDRLNAWSRGKAIYPLYVAISPSGLCNLKCIFCAYTYLQGEKIFLKREVLGRVLKEFKELDVKAVFYSGEGEPFLNKELPAIIADTHECGISSAVNTNGLLVTKEISEDIIGKLEFIRFSVNAGTSESYKKIHRSHDRAFDAVIKNISDAVKLKEKKKVKTTIGVQCLFLDENCDTLVDLAKVLKKIKVDYLAIKPFFKHPEIKFDNKIDIFENIDLARRLEAMATDDFKVVVRRKSFERYKARTYKHCLSIPFMAEIDCRGDVYPCGPYLGHKEYVYGNIYKNTFKEIWDSKKCKEIRRFLSTELDCSKCMPNCRNDAVNRFLWAMKNPPDHVNYI